MTSLVKILVLDFIKNFCFSNTAMEVLLDGRLSNTNDSSSEFDHVYNCLLLNKSANFSYYFDLIIILLLKFFKIIYMTKCLVLEIVINRII